jgi:hypothetical protein
MAGTALTSPWNAQKPENVLGNFTVANAEIINDGDPVGINSSGYIVCASKTQGAIVKCIGFAKMLDDLSGGTQTSVTGNVSTNPTNPVMVGVCRCIKLTGCNSTLVPSLAAGLPVYLAAAASSATVSAYTCALTSTNGDSIEELGFVLPNGVDLWLEAPQLNGLKYQTSGNSIVGYA